MPTGAKTRAPSEAATGRTRKEDWLDLAIRLLVDGGIEAVKIQAMARTLGVSRSSFYWFFESLSDLQDQLLEHWLRRNTGPIIERAMRPAETIDKAVCNVFECWVDPDLFGPELDMAVRLWGRREQRIRSVIDEADRQRVDALTRMFARYGYAAEEAFTRARVLYYTQIGHFALQVTESLDERFSHLASYLLTFTGRPPVATDIAAFERFVAAAKRKEAEVRV